MAECVFRREQIDAKSVSYIKQKSAQRCLTPLCSNGGSSQTGGNTPAPNPQPNPQPNPGGDTPGGNSGGDDDEPDQ